MECGVERSGFLVVEKASQPWFLHREECIHSWARPMRGQRARVEGKNKGSMDSSSACGAAVDAHMRVEWKRGGWMWDEGAPCARMDQDRTDALSPVEERTRAARATTSMEPL